MGTQHTNQDIWQAVKDCPGGLSALTGILEGASDEYAAWVNEEYQQLLFSAAQLTLNVGLAYENICHRIGINPERPFKKHFDPLNADEQSAFITMAYAVEEPLRTGLFFMLNGRQVWDWAFDQIRPNSIRTYATESSRT